MNSKNKITKREIVGMMKEKVFVPDNASFYDRLLSAYNGVRVILSIKKEVKITKEKERSIQQHRYYHGVVVREVSKETGDKHDDTHDQLKVQFLLPMMGFHGQRVPKEKVKEIANMLTTTTMTTVAMEEYLRQIRDWASAFLHVVIPLPNEMEYYYDPITPTTDAKSI